MSKLFTVTLFILAVASPAFAQGHHGISSDGRDFYVAYMPGIKPQGISGNVPANYSVLICSYTDNNTVTISYFDDNGREFQSASKVVQKSRCIQQQIDRFQMTPSRPGEWPEWKAAHIQSRYPISVQCYSEGSSSGGMYQAIPTAALGKEYVVASWFDDPKHQNAGWITFDSASSECMIIAPLDNTTVTITPNSSTFRKIIGVNSGTGADGTPHPSTVTLQKGQVYWVRSVADQATNDLSGSTIVADKPIAVLGGHERALLGDPSGWWTAVDNDVRDLMIEQMTPVEAWESEYPSIPFVPPPEVARILQVGRGDMYRSFTDDVRDGVMTMWKGSPPDSFSRPVSLYQSPAATFENVADPVDLKVSTFDAKGQRKKMYVVMYDYFQGQHDWDPGGRPPSGKGAAPQNDISYISANEMNVVPLDRWKTSAAFKVPQHSAYRGYQFINLITYRDSLKYIEHVYNGGQVKTLDRIPTIKRYDIPLHPELIGLTLQEPVGDYVLRGNTPFACYSYGRTQTTYKDQFGYAAPCGQLYGSRTETHMPHAAITNSCDGWDVTVLDTAVGDEGVADVMLLNDADGLYGKPGHICYNTQMFPSNPQFSPGEHSVTFQILIADPGKDAYAALYIVDRSGNDTIINLYYTAPKVTVSAAHLTFPNTMVGVQACSTCTIHILSTGIGDTATFALPSLIGLDRTHSFSFSSVPALPKLVQTGDSIIFSICFDPRDTLAHADSLPLFIGCQDTSITLHANGVTPIIVALDRDFGIVSVGDQVCHPVVVHNIGNGDLILDKSWLLHTNPDFTFEDELALPDTIHPQGIGRYNFCFKPSKPGPNVTRMDWGTNLSLSFAHQKKDTSLLYGNFVESVSDASVEYWGIVGLSSAASKLNVQFHAPGTKVHFDIFDLLGRPLISKEMNNETNNSVMLDLSTLSAGSYIIRVSSGQWSDAKRFELP